MAEYLSRSNNDLSDLDSFINESKTLLSRLQDEDESSDEEKMFVDHQGLYEVIFNTFHMDRDEVVLNLN